MVSRKGRQFSRAATTNILRGTKSYAVLNAVTKYRVQGGLRHVAILRVKRPVLPASVGRVKIEVYSERPVTPEQPASISVVCLPTTPEAGGPMVKRLFGHASSKTPVQGDTLAVVGLWSCWVSPFYDVVSVDKGSLSTNVGLAGRLSAVCGQKGTVPA